MIPSLWDGGRGHFNKVSGIGFPTGFPTCATPNWPDFVNGPGNGTCSPALARAAWSNAAMDRIVSIAPRAPLGFRLPDLPAVVERELRVASRRSATYWGRVSAASVAIAVAGWWMAGFTALGVTPQMGRAAFRVVAGVAAFMLLSSV